MVPGPWGMRPLPGNTMSGRAVIVPNMDRVFAISEKVSAEIEPVIRPCPGVSSARSIPEASITPAIMMLPNENSFTRYICESKRSVMPMPRSIAEKSKMPAAR